MSYFWQNVDMELDYQGMTRKELAEKADCSVSIFTKGNKINCEPSVILAMRIANILGVSIDYLLTGKSNVNEDFSKIENSKQIRLYRKYHKLIKKCENLSPENLSLLIKLADALEEKYTGQK